MKGVTRITELKALIRIFGERRRAILFWFGVVFVTQFFPTAVTILIGKIIDIASSPSPRAPNLIVQFSALIGCIIATATILRIVAKVRINLHVTSLGEELTLKTMDQFFLAPNAVNSLTSGILGQRLHQGREDMRYLVRLFYNEILWVTCSLIGAVFLLRQSASWMVISLLLFTGLIIYNAITSAVRQKAIGNEILDIKEQLTHQMAEGKRGSKTIIAAGTVESFRVSLSVLACQLSEKENYLDNVRSKQWVIFHSLSALMIGGGVGALGYQLYWGEITAGTMAAAAALLDSVRTQLSTFTETLSIMLDKWRGSIRLVRLVEREEDGVLRSQTFPVNWSKIECQRLDYSFGEKKVLKSFSLSLQRGEWVILQGASGAGKSTLVELLCRVRNPTAGMILFDQIPLSTITESEVRKNIALVLQQGMIFTATFRENLTLQSVTAAEDLLQVLKIVELDILVESLPMKLDTEIFEGGENFSGGEKQRIMIGRALLKNPSLLVLDESTAMIGAQQEESILTNIRANFPGMTVILVSHKSDAKKFADRVITL